MATALDVALWMVENFNATGRLIQKEAAQEIQKRFGGQYVFVGKNGNLQIKENVLRHFRKMTGDTAVWAKDSRYWRKRRPTDPGGVRQVDE